MPSRYLTDISSKLKTDKYNTYILSIIDTFSKYGGCYLLNNKNSDNVLGVIKDFIYKNGKPNILHSDNGKELIP